METQVIKSQKFQPATLPAPSENRMTAKSLFNQDEVKAKFQELLGKRSTSFITSVLQIVASNDLLAKADPVSIYHSAAVAATLDLPLNNSLGFAYIVPYNQKQKDGSYKTVAQFQIGYKGFIQLAQRSGQFRTISAAPIFEGQLVEQNPLTGFVFDFKQKKSELIVGYAAYFSLINGFEKTLFMTDEQLKAHGVRYSQTFKKGYGLWKDDFNAMAIKTVLKLLLAKFAPLSVEMQKAVIADQGIINDTEAQDVTYADNEPTIIDKEKERIRILIEEADTIEQLQSIAVHVDADQVELFEARKEQLTIAK
jgi:recombination protein RecT